ncbi:MAG: class I SAM-dependent methyltransferase [Thermoplasmata archaeon]
MTATDAQAVRHPADWDLFADVNASSSIVGRLFMEALFRGYRELLRSASFSGPLTILELGSGTGYVTNRIAETVPTRRVTLVDANRKMLVLARKTLESLTCEVSFVHQDFFRLRLEEEFDLVHSAGVVEHFDSRLRSKLLAAHARLVRPGGYCIVYAPTPTPYYRFWRGLVERLTLWPFTDEVPLASEQLVREVEATGLRVTAVNRVWDYFLTESGLLAQKV